LRIISGNFKGRTIKAPLSITARPTTDFAKTGLFNILNSKIYFEDLKVLDLFAGIGSISLEMQSRGVISVICVDEDPKCTKFIEQTAKDLEMNNLMVSKQDAFKYVKFCNQKFDLIFMDPPYELEAALDLPIEIFHKELLNPNGWLIQEHQAKTKIKPHPSFVETRKYGNVAFSFYQNL
jgi:16S rRNA (guanine966-N2)-methyltransferase